MRYPVAHLVAESTARDAIAFWRTTAGDGHLPLGTDVAEVGGLDDERVAFPSAVTLFQIPCRSGSPHGVFGCSKFAARACDDRACPIAATGANNATTTGVSTAVKNRPLM